MDLDDAPRHPLPPAPRPTPDFFSHHLLRPGLLGNIPCLALNYDLEEEYLAIVESFGAMVVTKVTSTGTFKKRQRLNSPSKLDEFLLDLTTEEEEEREGKDVLSLFSSSRSNSLFKSYCK